MKRIQKIKFIFGVILTSFAILGGLIFFLESFKIFSRLLDYSHLSEVFKDGSAVSGRIGRGRYEDSQNLYSGGGASNVPIFLGLCGIAGAILLMSLKTCKGDKTVKSVNATGNQGKVFI